MVGNRLERSLVVESRANPLLPAFPTLAAAEGCKGRRLAVLRLLRKTARKPASLVSGLRLLEASDPT